MAPLFDCQCSICRRGAELQAAIAAVTVSGAEPKSDMPSIDHVKKQSDMDRPPSLSPIQADVVLDPLLPTAFEPGEEVDEPYDYTDESELDGEEEDLGALRYRGLDTSKLDPDVLASAYAFQSDDELEYAGLLRDPSSPPREARVAEHAETWRNPTFPSRRVRTQADEDLNAKTVAVLRELAVTTWGSRARGATPGPPALVPSTPISISATSLTRDPRLKVGVPVIANREPLLPSAIPMESESVPRSSSPVAGERRRSRERESVDEQGVGDYADGRDESLPGSPRKRLKASIDG